MTFTFALRIVVRSLRARTGIEVASMHDNHATLRPPAAPRCAIRNSSLLHCRAGTRGAMGHGVTHLPQAGHSVTRRRRFNQGTCKSILSNLDEGSDFE